MYHNPVLLQQAIELLNVRADGIYVDLTFGGGGHSRLILEKLVAGKLIAFDQDKDALNNAIDDKRFIMIHQNFRFLENFLNFYQCVPVDGILADLGMSSYQIDEPSRGFSYMFPDAPLDMRMNENATKTAAQILNTYGTKELAVMLYKYAELPYSNKLAAALVAKRMESKFSKVSDLLEVVNKFTVPNKRYNVYSRVFQALRIEVNDEIAALEDMLVQSLRVLKPGGRMVVISYHSVEDRLVKNFFRSGRIDGVVEKDFYGNPQKKFRILTRKPLTPTAEEIEQNPRARSAKLRAAEKI